MITLADIWPDLVNLLVILGGVVETFGFLGGVFFWYCLFSRRLELRYPKEPEQEQDRCVSCRFFGGCRKSGVPGEHHVCSFYMKEDKPR